MVQPTTKRLLTEAKAGEHAADGATPLGAALAAQYLGKTSAAATYAAKASPAFTGVPTVNGLQLAPAATPYPKWRKALVQVRAGISDAKLLCLGDSTTLGYVAPPNNVATPALSSYPSDLAQQLNAYFAPAFVGMGIPANFGSSTDARWAAGAGWAGDAPAGIGWASQQLYKSTAATGDLVYTPGPQSGSVDRFDVYYIANGASPNFTITATGGAPVTVTPGAQNGVFKATCSAAAVGTGNSVAITATGTTRIVGIEPWLSTATRVRVANAGTGGAKGTTAAATGAWKTLDCIKAYAPDLTIIDYGLNDAAVPETAAAFQTALETLIDAARISGDAVLMIPPPPAPGNLDAGMASYLPVYNSVAASKGVGLVDITGRWVSRAAVNTYGYYSDTLHPSRIGYGDMAQAVTTLIRSI